MITWLLKRLGFHVCEHYTKWHVLSAKSTRKATDAERQLGINIVHTWFRWQERRCLECHKVQWMELPSTENETEECCG